MKNAMPIIRISALGLVLILSHFTAPAFAVQEKIQIEVLHHTDETDADLERVKFVLAHIPLPVQKTIAAKGIKITLTPLMTYDEPDKSGQQVFRSGGTIDNVGGMFEGKKLRVILPERASWKNGPPHPQGNGLKSVLPHELGHAWDNACGGLSRSADFKTAYDADLARFGNTELKKWSYQITGISTGDANVATDSGRAECLAGAFSHLVGPINRRDTDGYTTAFSHVCAFLESYESSLQDACWQEPVEPKKREQQIKPLDEKVQSQAQKDIDSAIGLLNQQRWSESIRILDRVIKIDPSCQKAYALRGNAKVWLKQYRNAIADYTSLIRLAPDKPEGYALRARAFGWLGDRTKQQQDELRAKRGANFQPKKQIIRTE